MVASDQQLMRLGFLALQLQTAQGNVMSCAQQDSVILIKFETNIQSTCIFKGKPLIAVKNDCVA